MPILAARNVRPSNTVAKSVETRGTNPIYLDGADLNFRIPAGQPIVALRFVVPVKNVYDTTEGTAAPVTQLAFSAFVLGSRVGITMATMSPSPRFGVAEGLIPFPTTGYTVGDLFTVSLFYSVIVAGTGVIQYGGNDDLPGIDLAVLT